MTRSRLQQNLRVITQMCMRCRKRYIVNVDTLEFHKNCKITNWKAEWRK